MQIIPTGYQPTLEAARAYLARNPDVQAAYRVGLPGGWDELGAAWSHYNEWGNKPAGGNRTWDFPSGPIPPAVIAPVVTQSTGAGLLEGKIFGVDKKLLLIGAAAFLVFGSKD